MDYEKQMNKAVCLQTKLAPLVKRLMSEALKALGLDYFWFVRLMEGNFHLSVGVVPPMVELYRTRKTEDLYFRNAAILAQKQTTVFWELHESESLAYDMLNKLGLQQGICIFRRKNNYVDVFYVASTKKITPNIYDIYLNNPQSIMRLIGFFQEAVMPQLPLCDKEFLLPYMDKCVLKLPSGHEKFDENLKGFYDATKLKKYTLHKENRELSLSLRELQCLHFLAKGSTSKDIALALQISYRTVEHYLSNIRNKAGCADKAELIELYRKNDVAMWFEV
jgi:DNA-binding CsgD family transcriptional regulator